MSKKNRRQRRAAAEVPAATNGDPFVAAEPVLDDEGEQTLAASSDVVALIRETAARAAASGESDETGEIGEIGESDEITVLVASETIAPLNDAGLPDTDLMNTDLMNTDLTDAGRSVPEFDEAIDVTVPFRDRERLADRVDAESDRAITEIDTQSAGELPVADTPSDGDTEIPVWTAGDLGDLGDDPTTVMERPAGANNGAAATTAGTDLAGTDLDDADLDDADLDNPDLDSADLDSADLDSADAAGHRAEVFVPARPTPVTQSTPRPAKQAAANAVSLIAGAAPPPSDRTYWESGMIETDAPVVVDRRAPKRRRVPTWLLVLCAVIAVVTISVVAALVISSSGATPAVAT